MLTNLKPVRKIRPSSRSITGKLVSLKTSSTHHFESSLERDYLTLLEYDPEVAVFLAQPISIFYSFEDKSRRYTPDVLVHYLEELKRLPMLVEIKYEAELESKRVELQPRFDAARRYAEERNFEFAILTEKQIRTPYLENIKFLSRYRQSSINKRYAELIMHQFKTNYPLTVEELIKDNDQQITAALLHTLWTMLTQHILTCDMQNKLSMNSLLWIRQKS